MSKPSTQAFTAANTIALFAGKSGSLFTDGVAIWGDVDGRTLRRAVMAAKKKNRTNRLGPVKEFLLDLHKRRGVGAAIGRGSAIEEAFLAVPNASKALTTAEAKRKHLNGEVDKANEAMPAKPDDADETEAGIAAFTAYQTAVKMQGSLCGEVHDAVNERDAAEEDLVAARAHRDNVKEASIGSARQLRLRISAYGNLRNKVAR